MLKKMIEYQERKFLLSEDNQKKAISEVVKVSCSLAKWFRKDFEYGGFNPNDPRQIRTETEMMDKR